MELHLELIMGVPKVWANMIAEVGCEGMRLLWWMWVHVGLSRYMWG